MECSLTRCSLPCATVSWAPPPCRACPASAPSSTRTTACTTSFSKTFLCLHLLWTSTFKTSLIEVSLVIIVSRYICAETNAFPCSHDNSRFLNKQTNQQLYRNALSMVVFGVGIPMCVFPSFLFQSPFSCRIFRQLSANSSPLKQRVLRHRAGVLRRK